MAHSAALQARPAFRISTRTGFSLWGERALVAPTLLIAKREFKEVF